MGRTASATRAASAAVAAAALLAAAAAGAWADFPARQGLSVGTRPNLFDGSDVGSDVVKNGEVVSWTVGHPFSVPQVVNYIDLYVSLGHADNFTNEVNATLDWQTDGVFAAQVFTAGGEANIGQHLSVGVGYRNQKRIHIQLDCTNQTATGAGSVSLDLINYRSLSMVFSYNCSGSHNYRYGFNVATAPKPGEGKLLVENGRVVDDLSLAVPDDEDELTIYVYMDLLTPGNGTQQYDAVADFDDVMLQVGLDPFNGVVSPKGSAVKMKVHLDCDPAYRGKELTSAVTITFIFPFAEGGVKYVDAAFDFSKTCPHYTSGGGWSGAGIFFFTVFILTLVFCVAGCAINRLHFHKSGADIIPGMPLYRKCLGGGDGADVYSPQADLESTGPAAGGGDYGSYDDAL